MILSYEEYLAKEVLKHGDRVYRQMLPKVGIASMSNLVIFDDSSAAWKISRTTDRPFGGRNIWARLLRPDGSMDMSLWAGKNSHAVRSKQNPDKYSMDLYQHGDTDIKMALVTDPDVVLGMISKFLEIPPDSCSWRVDRC